MGNSNKEKKARRKIASVQKALDILNLFDTDVKELGNKEIANKLNLPTGTVSGLLYTLKTNHYLDQNQDNQKYRLGLRFLDRASVILDQFDIRNIAYPQLKKLSNWCGESINLAIRDESEIVYIERLQSAHSLGFNHELGMRAPIHSTALGKAIVSHLPLNDLSVMLEDYKFFPVTQYTIVERRLFEEELAKVRERGYSVDDQENEVGGRCISAPILDHRHYPVAAISVSAPIQRLPDDQIKVFGEKLREITSTISRRIGFHS